jgi:serine/threonine-protein kinase
LTPAQAAHPAGTSPTRSLRAHTRGLVHRDVKPANLLFDEHGTVRVADFGLARALAEASWTEPTGALVGTARYAAPEQGTGATLDARADLYALGVVLVESVTGRVPEVADTLIGTLAVRARVPLAAPEELGALAPVVERAGRTQPSERYPDAITMAEALTDASRHLPPPGPLTLVGLDAHVDPHPTELGNDGLGLRPGRRCHGRHGACADGHGHTGGDRARPASRAVRAPCRARDRRRARHRGAAGGGAAPGTLDDRGHGRCAAARRSHAGRSGVASRQGRARGPRRAARRGRPGRARISQAPSAGAFLDDGGTVRLVVSLRAAPVVIPDVAGQPEDQATLTLAGAGFAVDPGTTTTRTSPPASRSAPTRPLTRSTRPSPRSRWS